MFTVWKSRDVRIRSTALGRGRLHFVLLPSKVLVTRVANSHFLRDTEVRKGKGLRRALLVEYATTVTTVMFSVGEREGIPTTKTDIRVYPLRSGLRVHKGRVCDSEIFWREIKT
jgi:hypothetical protein